MFTSNKTRGSFGPDGRRVSTGGGLPPPKTLKCVARAGSGFSTTTKGSGLCGGVGGGLGRSMHSTSKLFQTNKKLVVARAPVMGGLSVNGMNSLSGGSLLARSFQRPMTKRRSYDKNAESALKTCSLGQKRRFDGMAKLMARAGKGLSFIAPKIKIRGEGDTSDESDSEEEESKEPERPFEPLMVWKSPAEGGEAKGLPPRMMTVTRSDEYGVEETVTELLPVPAEAYAKESAFVPPVLAKWLRPHQREGVLFIYECVMGLRGFDGAGCILADDMGLGKTLQSVCLIWTLLQTGITANKAQTAKRIIVICPCSLVKNWDNEFIKWLGPGKVKTLALAEGDRKTVEKNIDCFVKTKMFNVLIASYETIRTHVGRLNKYKDCCDLLVCDEAHRLKNRENQTSMALNSIPVKRRVLLTGTPMQNDLEEFYAMVDFTNPGILGTPEDFRRKTLAPILRGREPDATEKQKQRMMEIQQGMSETVNNFILRRVNTLNAQHLPPKLVQVVCCNLTEIQKNMYSHLCDSKAMQHVLNGKQVNCLGSIQMLMKLCNHPSLVVDDDSSNKAPGRTGGRAKKKISYSEMEGEKSSAAPGADGIAKFMPYEAMGGGRSAPVMPELSGKMFVLWRLMKEMRRPGNGADKIVIVSNYTQTLDLIGRMCRENNWGFCRLDGSISMKKRQKMCDDFNDPSSSLIAFLLSSKAGGCGLNLIGGNRLVLFDPDWNPAVDKQAAARCWRDGQKKRCFTYRFMATGTVEEKIFQRQLSKEGLQSVVDDKQQVNELSSKDLKNLFKLREGTPSDTHDKLKCERCKIVVDDAEADAAKVLPKKLAACRELLEEVMKLEDSSTFLTPLKPEEHGVSMEEYQKSVKQPIDFGTVLNRLDKKNGSAGYGSPAAFTKDVNRVFSNVMKVWDTGHDLAERASRLQLWWVQQWTELVPKLMSMKPDSEEDHACEKKEDESIGQLKTEGDEEPSIYINNERGDDYQEQLGMPDEENMRSWSHHYSTDTVDDPIFRAAMRGYDAVSFVFGLEVTWDLIQQRQQEEEEKQAMLELEAMQEMEQANAAKGDDSDDGSSDEESDNEETKPQKKKRQKKEAVKEDNSSSDEESEDDEILDDAEAKMIQEMEEEEEDENASYNGDDDDGNENENESSEDGDENGNNDDTPEESLDEQESEEEEDEHEAEEEEEEAAEEIVEEVEEAAAEEAAPVLEELEASDTKIDTAEPAAKADNETEDSEMAEAAVDAPVELPPDEADVNVWTCHECTYANEDANVKQCQMCSEPNPNYKRRKPRRRS